MPAKKYYETPEFLKAQREAYEILAESGFDDIEMFDDKGEPSRNMLKGMSTGDLYRGLYKPETEEYYRQARLHVHRMRPGPRRAVWRCHAEGMSVARIHRHLGERYGLPLGRVRKIVKDTEKKMFRAWRRDEEARGAELREKVQHDRGLL